MATGAVNITFGAVIGQFVSGVRQMGSEVGRLSNQLNSNLSASFAAADREQRVFDRGLGRLGSNLQSVGGNLSAFVTLPLIGVGIAGLKAASDMEQAGVSFRVLLKDANLAARTINDLKEFASSTPFEFTDVQAGAKQLLSYGFAVGDLKTLLTDAGNLASGFGVQIGEVTRVLGRLKSGDFGEAFERLRDFGIGRDLLEAKGLKFDKSGQYQGSVQQAFSVIQSVIRERFGGQIEEQSKTIGGIFSNIKDQANFALAEIGDKLIGVFNLKEVGAGLVTTMGALRTQFTSLPEPVQQLAVGALAVAAAIGPLTFGLGTVIKLIPLISSGFAALTGPIGLAALAVGAAAFLIISNWNSIKTVLTNSGIWESVKGLVRSGMDVVKTVIGAAVALGTALWTKFGGSITTIASAAFGIVSGIFNTGAGVITGIFKVFTGLLTGNWAKFGEGLQNITVSIFNGITQLFTAGFKGILGLTAGLLGSVGLDDAAKKLNDYAASLQAVTIPLRNLKDVSGGIDLPGVTVTGSKPTTATGPTSGLSTTSNEATKKAKEAKTALEIAQEALGKLEAKIQDFTFRGITIPPALLVQYDSLKSRVEAAQQALEKIKAVDLGNLKPIDLSATVRLNKLEEIQDGPKLTGLIEFQQRSKQQFADLNKQLADDKNALRFSLAEIPGVFGSVRGDLQKLADSDPFNSRGFMTKAGELAEGFKTTMASVKGALISGSLDALAGFGEAIGAGANVLDAGKNALKSVFKNIIGLIADQAIQIGKALILVAAPLILSGAGAGLGFKNLAAGAALILAGGAAKGLAATAFANGGLVTGPTLGLVGEGIGTSKSNPELIIPVDRLREYLKPQQGNGGNFSHRIEVSGSDLAIILERHNESTYYTR